MKKNAFTLILALVAFFASFNALNAQTAKYYNSPIESTAGSPEWFFIMNMGTSNKILELSSGGTAINAVATPITSNNDRQLWRFEKSGSTYTIINKAQPGAITVNGAAMTWNATASTAFTISAVGTNWAIQSGTQYFDATGTTLAGVTSTTATSAQWIFVKAPVASTAADPVWMQLTSRRTAAVTIPDLESGVVKWTSTSNMGDEKQLWRLQKATTGYNLYNKSAATSPILLGTVHTASNLTTTAGTALEIVATPLTDGYFFFYVPGSSYNQFDYSSNLTCGIYTYADQIKVNGGFKLKIADESAPLEISGVSLSQGTMMTGIGNRDVPVIRMAIEVTGMAGSLLMSNLKMRATGTTDITDVTSIKIYYSGKNAKLHRATATLLDSVEASSSALTLTFDKTASLKTGTNYIWIAYDIAETAVEGNKVDARITGYNVNNTDITLSTGSTAATTTIFLSAATLFEPGDDGSRYYRIPALITAADSSLVAVCDRRNNNNADLPGDIDVVVRRSTDNGKTWSPQLKIAGEGTTTGYGDPALLLDKFSGKIHCFFAANQGLWASTPTDPIRIYQSVSSDNGITWSTPKDITDMIYGANAPIAATKTWKAAFIGSGHALQLRDGRMMFSMAVRETEAQSLNNYIAYSDDFGETWTTSTSKACNGGDESKLVELSDGRVMISVRHAPNRYVNYSSNRGITWGTQSVNSYLVDPACNGEILEYTSTKDGLDKNRILHSLCYSTTRSNLTILMSEDNGTTWPVKKTLNSRGSAYSTLAILPDGSIGCYFEDDATGDGYNMQFVSFSLSWLTDGAQNWDIVTEEPAIETKAASIYSKDGMIYVVGDDAPYTITSITGLVLDPSQKLEPGIYIVTIGGISTKVEVK
ncbi:MAG: exo-alpha-sialidase [Bacteroidales bacterium]|nr:exo-alpha-sialidase [Bacteroidales bacterium]MDD4821821.1 exo-alpha-sialidase [Bacteroidales bacterium]